MESWANAILQTCAMAGSLHMGPTLEDVPVPYNDSLYFVPKAKACAALQGHNKIGAHGSRAWQGRGAIRKKPQHRERHDPLVGAQLQACRPPRAPSPGPVKPSFSRVE
eukprot:2407818-Prymnesium_polylepis.1